MTRHGLREQDRLPINQSGMPLCMESMIPVLRTSLKSDKGRLNYEVGIRYSVYPRSMAVGRWQCVMPVPAPILSFTDGNSTVKVKGPL